MKDVVHKLNSRRELWLYIKNQKLMLNFHLHRKSPGLTISQLLWLLPHKTCKIRQCRHSPLLHKFQYIEKIVVFLRFCEAKSRKLSVFESWCTVLLKIKSEEKCMVTCKMVKYMLKKIHSLTELVKSTQLKMLKTLNKK